MCKCMPAFGAPNVKSEKGGKGYERSNRVFENRDKRQTAGVFLVLRVAGKEETKHRQ